ncbi:MAG: GNAT family N-acetyltransferase [Bacteroidota bacterium]
MTKITINAPDSHLAVRDFLNLVQKVWPGAYNPNKAATALENTQNFTAWDGDILIGCARLLTDGYFFSTIPEILVDPAYQKMGIGKALMEKLWAHSPSSLAFGVQSGNEDFFEELGYEKGLPMYQRRKDRNQATPE